MSGDGLEVETSVLTEAGSALRAVHHELSASGRRFDPPSSVLADAHLAGRLRAFADGWERRRTEMLADVEALGETASQAAEAYERIEIGLVAALQGRA